MKNTFKKYYNSPFVNYCGRQVYCENSNIHAFDFVNITETKKRKIINILNGGRETLKKFNPNLLKNTYDSFITYKGERFISIRGWGKLTGVGGCNLEEEIACKVQDDFADWIIQKIKYSQAYE